MSGMLHGGRGPIRPGGTDFVLALGAIAGASVLVGYLATGGVDLPALLHAQRTTPALWLLDAVPVALAMLRGIDPIAASPAPARSPAVSRATAAVHERSEGEARRREHATHDVLTGLANRALLYERVGEAIRGAGAEPRCVAVLVLDLDGFRHVNDVLGHFNGDGLLREIGSRLEGVVDAPNLIARPEGDEFAVLFADSVTPEGIPGEVARIRRALDLPLAVEHLTVELRASIGVAWYPAHGFDAAGLVRRAEIAMREAKGSTVDFVAFRPAMDRYDPQRLLMMGELRRAIREDRLVLHYQPRVALPGGRVLGVEALVRWPHRDELIPPADFVPLAEGTGLIRPLSGWVLRTALAQVAAWRREGFELEVSVNLSERDLHDAGFTRRVEERLAEFGLEARQLWLELPERVVMANPAQSLRILGELDALGVRAAIDDFGAGPSSFAELCRLPVAALKIDRSFVTSMAERPRDAVLVGAAIGLAHELGMRVTAQGVESEREWHWLIERGCDDVQGHHVSVPLEAGAIAEVVRKRAEPPAPSVTPSDAKGASAA